MEILVPILILFGIGVVAALLLTVTAAYFGVKDDERAAEIREALPGANCGACGFSGCDEYAKALSQGKTDKANLCVPGGDGTASEIAAIIGVEAGDVIERVAYVSCNGSCSPDERKYEYDGPKTCEAAKMYFSGDRMCTYACLGYGDCMKVCPRDAICIGENGVANIDPRRCIGCGLCIRTCPSKIIYLVNDTSRIVVKCSSHSKGAVVRRSCKNGCIACGKCEKVCPSDAIHVIDNLATIDYEKCTACGKCVEACPVQCIHEGNFICGAHFE